MNRRPFHRLLHLFLLILVVASAARAESACRYETAIGLPGWITTGVWNEERLVVVDVLKRKLVEISPRGLPKGIPSALGAHLEGKSPTRIRLGPPAKDGQSHFVVESVGGKLVEIDRSLAPRRRYEMSTTNLQSGNRKLTHLIDWVLSGDGKEVLGYADIEATDEEGVDRWKNAFVRFPLDRPRSFSIVHERPFPDDSRIGMHLTYPLVASIGSTAYVALVDDRMRLWRFDPQDKELRPLSPQAFPVHLRDKLAPIMPSIVGWKGIPDVMEAAAQAEMPAGLFAWRDSLFLLSRRLEKGQRQWFLSKIDPDEEKLLWTVRVPSSAHHLTVIPGPNEWAFLEKGPVAAPLNQVTHHIRFVNSAQMRSQVLRSLCN